MGNPPESEGLSAGQPTPDDEAPDDEADDDEPETGPLRRCVVTRNRDYRTKMIRFVVGPDRTIVPDLAAKLPGRGIWLSARRDVIETARTRGAFARAAQKSAKGAVTVPIDLASRVESGLTRRVTELLGLTRRAGQAVCGFQKARERLQAGRVALVVQANDGSAEERTRFLSGIKNMPVVAPLPGAALGAIFGRDHVVHVVIAPGRLAEALTIETERLAGIAGSPEKNETKDHPANRAAGLMGQAGR